MDLEGFEQLAKTRRATRHFESTALDQALLERLLETARWAPSGYNLQPTHFFVVQDPQVKASMSSICMNQSQIEEAPAVVVFAGDKEVASHHLEGVIETDLRAQAINEDYAKMLRQFVKLAFDKGPLGIHWLWKALLVPIVRCIKPIPGIPAVHKRYWVAKQVMLSSMVFMLAAQSAGLATVPMEGFDEGRVRKLLKIPNHFVIPVIVPVGYATSGILKKTRLPLEPLVHWI